MVWSHWKNAGRPLEERAGKMRAMETSLSALQHVGVPTISVNQFGRVVSCNRHATTLFRVEGGAAIGREWHTVVRSERTATCCALCETRRALRRGEEPQPVQARIRIDSGFQSVVMIPLPSSRDVSGDIGFLILDSFSANASAQPPPVTASARVLRIDEDRFIDDLTARERDILRCVVEGLDARSIGRELGISHATARNYVQRILTKLGVRNKAEAVTVALTHNLLAS